MLDPMKPAPPVTRTRTAGTVADGAPSRAATWPLPVGSARAVDIQLWSYNYDPEPTGIGPLIGVLARMLAHRGHRIEVVAAHPHYPEPRWGRRLTPYSEVREGIPIHRLPLWVGRGTARQRILQELTFAAALSAYAPRLVTPEVVLAVSPSFPALLPAIINARARRIPWVLAVKDILPDGALRTGILEDGVVVKAARRFETAAYRSAERIVVISEACAHNLRSKGVPDAKLARIYDMASRPLLGSPRRPEAIDQALVLNMGNIGHTQDLGNVTRAFESSSELAALGARLVMAGDGVAGNDVRAAIRTQRVEVTGIVDDDRLEGLLQRAAIALVTQQYEGLDWNLPSKLMNFMAYGIPVVAAVRPDSEVASIVRKSGGGWVSDNRDASDCARVIAAALRDPEELHRRGERGRAFAHQYFSPERAADQFEAVLEQAVALGSGRRHR